MAKRNTVSRALAVIEEIARRQPIGVSELSRVLDEDKSAVQRALSTLAEEGWIQAQPQKPTRWELSNRIFMVGALAHNPNDLRIRARPVMAELREKTNETVILNVVSGRILMVSEVLESAQLLRVSAGVGMAIPPRDSATGRAMLARMTPEERMDFLESPPDEAMLEDFEQVLQHGYFSSRESWGWASTNIAAPIFDSHGKPHAALVISAPADRLSPSDCKKFGKLVATAAEKLSTGFPS